MSDLKIYDYAHATPLLPRKGSRRLRLDAIGRGDERPISQVAYIKVKAAGSVRSKSAKLKKAA